MGFELKVNLFVPGVGKSGTSSLHAYLNEHPDICMSNIKEPHFFAMEKVFNKGFSWYNSLFDAKPGAKFHGESSTTYILSDISIKRIKEYVRKPKFIIILRDPIKRIYSHYTWLYSLNIETLPFKDAILSDINTPFDPNKPINGNFKNYFLESSYGSLVGAYFNAFGKENIYIITTENLKKKPLDTINECFTFLGLQKLYTITEKQENITNVRRDTNAPFFIKKASHILPGFIKDFLGLRTILKKIYSKPIMTDEEKNWLRNLLKEEIIKLKEITNNEFPEWVDFK